MSSAVAATFAPYRYINCYSYAAPTATPLPLHPYIPAALFSLQGCANKCINHTIFGVAQGMLSTAPDLKHQLTQARLGNQCYCGDSLASAQPEAASNCYSDPTSRNCTGNTRQRCGSSVGMLAFGKIRNYGDCSSATYFDNTDTCRTVIGNRAGITQYRLGGSMTASITGTGTGGTGPVTATPGAGWNATGTNAAPSGYFFGTGAQAGELCRSRTVVMDGNSTVSIWPAMTEAPVMVMGAM